MKTVICTIFFLLTALTIFGQIGVIQGQVYDRNDSSGLAFAVVQLVNTKIVAVADEDGNFKMDSIPNGTYDLKVSYVGYGDNILTSLTISSDTISNIKLEFPPPCEYDKHAENKTCPICAKEDKVIPIVYGFPIRKLNKKKYYYAGCVMSSCEPNWYCKRDKHKF